eukprot:567819-Amphidinium_carterae.1
MSGGVVLDVLSPMWGGPERSSLEVPLVTPVDPAAARGNVELWLIEVQVGAIARETSDCFSLHVLRRTVPPIGLASAWLLQLWRQSILVVSKHNLWSNAMINIIGPHIGDSTHEEVVLTRGFCVKTRSLQETAKRAASRKAASQ